MNNIDILSLFYKFSNRCITANKLYEELCLLDKSNELIDIRGDIKRLIDEYPIIEDEYVLNQRTKYNFLRDDKNTKLIDELSNEEVDSLDRWNNIFNYIENNKYINDSINIIR